LAGSAVRTERSAAPIRTQRSAAIGSSVIIVVD
jgi:hypothetical protein